MSRNHWKDPKLLKSNGKIARHWIYKQGVKICTDEKERERAMMFLLPIFEVFWNEISRSSLSLIYLYRQSDQKVEFSTCDGRCSVSADEDTSAIGLSVELLHSDYDYCVMVIIHELAHLFRKGEENFFLLMDDLILRYNKATGACIANDYKESEKCTTINYDKSDSLPTFHHPMRG